MKTNETEAPYIVKGQGDTIKRRSTYLLTNAQLDELKRLATLHGKRQNRGHSPNDPNIRKLMQTVGSDNSELSIVPVDPSNYKGEVLDKIEKPGYYWASYLVGPWELVGVNSSKDGLKVYKMGWGGFDYCEGDTKWIFIMPIPKGNG